MRFELSQNGFSTIIAQEVLNLTLRIELRKNDGLHFDDQKGTLDISSSLVEFSHL